MNPVEGRCFTFNASASGYMRGDGCSGITLKYQPPNEEDHEATFRAGQMGQNGRSATLTAPNGLAQEDVIWKAIKEAAITPAESNVWDCHGTGTSLGDPIEVGAIRKIMMKDGRENALIINTNKANIGHLEGGAAMGSLLAVTYEAKHCFGDPSNHLRQLNPHLEQSSFDAFFNSELGEFYCNQGNVHVSSFGFGGTNGHGIMWGRKLYDLPSDAFDAAMRKLKMLPPPEIRVNGTNPENWDYDYPEKMKPGDKYSLNTEGDNVKWLKASTQEDEEDVEVFQNAYYIAGSFNDWEGEPMMDGDVPGLRTITITIPTQGYVEFNFREGNDEDKTICPSVDKCHRKTVPVMGPQANVKNSWVAQGAVGKELRIDLFVSGARTTVMWLVR